MKTQPVLQSVPFSYVILGDPVSNEFFNPPSKRLVFLLVVMIFDICDHAILGIALFKHAT